MRKHERALRHLARAHGAVLTMRRSNHFCLTKPNGKQVFASGSPSDARAVKNLIQTLKAAQL